MLEIKNLKVNINEKNILNGLNLKINKGEVHVIMGINGSGKSTLAKTITKHYECNIIEGEMLYKSKNLINMEVSDIANSGIFMSFQNPIEIPGVNNSYFLKTAFNEKRNFLGKEELNAMEFLKYIKEKINNYNINLDFLKRDLNDGFSGGEKKKNELLQMIILDPDLMILDEIDSGLDVDTIKIVSEVINNILLDKEKSLIMITHYDKLINLIKPDFVHVLKNGKIIKTGGPELAKEIQKNGFE